MSRYRKDLISWAMYDWANSAFATTVMAGFFPVFFKLVLSKDVDPTLSTARLGFAISISSLLIAILSPFLGVLSDLRGLKKKLTLWFMMISILGCIGLSFLDQGQWIAGAWIYGLAFLGFNASCVFYDSLLPSVAKNHESDFASGLGYGLGYLGGGVLLTLNVLMMTYPHVFQLDSPLSAVRASFVSVAIWWIVFSIPFFRYVQEPEVRIHIHILPAFRQSFLSVLTTWKNLIGPHRNLGLFLLAYWLFIDGIYTVMTMAVDYGIALGFSSENLIAALLITQFIGFPFALLFSKLSEKLGSKSLIQFSLLIYSLTVLASIQMSKAWHFYLLAGMIGMVQGGVQALSRSLFARMIPETHAGELFGFFNLVGKFASILGPFIVGLGALMTGSSRYGRLGLLILFILGSGLLTFVKEPERNST